MNNLLLHDAHHHSVSSFHRRSLPHFPAMDDQPLSLHSLSSMRSLIINPSTPKSTISTILKTLTNSPKLTHQTLKLLSDLAIHHPSYSQLVYDSLLRSTESPTRLGVEALATVSELISPERLELEDGRFVSLCFGLSMPARMWMLKNAGYRFEVRPEILFTVLLGFTNDPYPYVRVVSLEGLVGLSERGEFCDVGMVNGCYQRAVQLLDDMEDCVRISAVRVVRFHLFCDEFSLVFKYLLFCGQFHEMKEIKIFSISDEVVG